MFSVAYLNVICLLYDRFSYTIAAAVLKKIKIELDLQKACCTYVHVSNIYGAIILHKSHVKGK